MPKITTKVVLAVAPNCKDAEGWATALDVALSAHGFVDTVEIASFLAQAAHECGDFNVLSENLNYSADALVKLWPKRFTPELAAQVARKPQSIANNVYANRLGNGSPASNEGWLYRGRGCIQITGKAAYTAFSTYTKSDVNVVAQPDRVASEKGLAIESALWFWESNVRKRVADIGCVLEVTKRVNGGTNGLADRTRRFVAVKRELLSAS